MILTWNGFDRINLCRKSHPPLNIFKMILDGSSFQDYTLDSTTAIILLRENCEVQCSRILSEQCPDLRNNSVQTAYQPYTDSLLHADN